MKSASAKVTPSIHNFYIVSRLILEVCGKCGNFTFSQQKSHGDAGMVLRLVDFCTKPQDRFLQHSLKLIGTFDGDEICEIFGDHIGLL